MKTKGVDQMRRLYQAIETLRPDALRGKKQLRKSDVARLLNESDQTLTNWENRGISKEGLIQIQEEIGCSLTWVRDGSGSMRIGPHGPHEQPSAPNARDKTLETLIRYMPLSARTMTIAYVRCLLEMMEKSPEMFADKKQISEWLKWSKQHGQTAK